jgi:hypothetical protein
LQTELQFTVQKDSDIYEFSNELKPLLKKLHRYTVHLGAFDSMAAMRYHFLQQGWDNVDYFLKRYSRIAESDESVMVTYYLLYQELSQVTRVEDKNKYIKKIMGEIFELRLN